MLFRNIARQEKSCKTSKSFSNRLINDATLDTELRQYFSTGMKLVKKKKKIKPQNYEYIRTYVLYYIQFTRGISTVEKSQIAY